MRRMLLILLALTLTACGALPGNPQGYAGVVKVELEPCEAGSAMRCGTYISGKEVGSLKWHVETRPDGTYTIDVEETGVAAFEGQAVRGEVERAVAEALEASVPGIVEGVVKAINPVPQ